MTLKSGRHLCVCKKNEIVIYEIDLIISCIFSVHDFGKMQNTSPARLLGEELNIDVF